MGLDVLSPVSLGKPNDDAVIPQRGVEEPLAGVADVGAADDARGTILRCVNHERMAEQLVQLDVRQPRRLLRTADVDDVPLRLRCQLSAGPSPDIGRLGTGEPPIERNVNDDIAPELKERYFTTRTIWSDRLKIHDDWIHNRKRRRRHGRHERNTDRHEENSHRRLLPRQPIPLT